MAAIEGSLDDTNRYVQTALGGLPDIIKSWQQTLPTDTNLYSARKSEREFLHKNRRDTAAQGINFGVFVPGIEAGIGGTVDEEGNAELQSLIVRSFLKVPELIYNKVSVTGGEMWNTEGGVIKSVTADGENAYILEMEVEEGDSIGLAVDDICRGHYNHSGGFVTSYFRVTNVNASNSTVRAVLGADGDVPGGMNHPPTAYMNIARYGSFTVRARQRSQCFSSNEGYILLLDNVDNYKIVRQNYKGVFGNVPASLYPENMPVNPNDVSIYLKNVIAENFFQIAPDGKALKTVRDRGIWEASPDEPYLCSELYQDEVWHDSCKYRCISEGTAERPAYNSTGWLLIAGDTELTLAVYSSGGETFLQGHVNTVLSAVVKRGLSNITGGISAADWQWTRKTGDTVSDTVWNDSHAGSADSIHVTDEDMNGVTGRFVCEVYVRDGDVRMTEEVGF